MATIQSFTPQGSEKSTQALSDVCPIGKVFDAKNLSTSNVRKLLRGLAQEQVRYEASIFDLINQYIPNFTISYIEEWEQQLGIPDECFNTIDFTDDERRRNIIIKLAFITLVTPQDYIDLGIILQLSVIVEPFPDTSVFPLTFPVTFSGSFFLNIFLEGVEDPGFPFTFPIIFGDPNANLYECLVLKYKQAYIGVDFIYDTNVTQLALLDAEGNPILDGDGNVIFVPVL